jgi:hypothetical protein
VRPLVLVLSVLLCLGPSLLFLLQRTGLPGPDPWDGGFVLGAVGVLGMYLSARRRGLPGNVAGLGAVLVVAQLLLIAAARLRDLP